MQSQPLLSVVLVIAASPFVRGQDWTPLIDGQSFSGWTTQGGNPVQPGGWTITSGVLHLDAANGRGGNLLTAREYGDFELIFDWKIPAGANNGIKYRVKDFDGSILGCEYQIIDDEGHGNLPPEGKTATLYDIYATLPHHALHPPGEWNRGRIVVNGNRIEHWLNGRLVVEADVGSQEWDTRIAKSKFHDVEGFGRNRRGKIMLTDHGDEISFRNIFIRELEAAELTSLPAVAAGACRLVNHCSTRPAYCPRTRSLAGRFRRLMARNCR